MRYVMACCFLLLFGCSTLSDTPQPDVTSDFADRMMDVNEAYHTESNAQILKNILRARDRQGRTYTNLSQIKFAPETTDTVSGSAGNIVLGSDMSDVIASLGGSGSRSQGQAVEFDVSPTVVGPDGQSVYEKPIEIETFNNYYTQWPKDIVQNLMVQGFRRLDKASKDSSLSEFNQSILGQNVIFEVQMTNSTLSHTVDGRTYAVDLLNYKAREEEGRSKWYIRPEEEDVVYCVSTSPTTFRCSQNMVFPGCIAKADDGSCAATGDSFLFAISENGIYNSRLGSIDDMIYTVGRALRSGSLPREPGSVACPPGSAICTHTEPVNECLGCEDKMPLFALYTDESLKAAGRGHCAAYFMARAQHHGTTYYAGPPQNYPGQTDSCYFDDRSSTVLTLIAEIIDVHQVPVDLAPSSIFLR